MRDSLDWAYQHRGRDSIWVVPRTPKEKCQCPAKTKPPGVSLLVQLVKAQGTRWPFCPGENDLEFVTSPGQGAKKVYCCSFLSFRFVEANHYCCQGWHGRDSVSGRCLLIGPETFYWKR